MLELLLCAAACGFKEYIESLPAIINDTKVTSAKMGPVTFSNVQDASNWLVSNGILEASAANGFMSRAQFTTKSKTKGYTFSMNRLDGGFSIYNCIHRNALLVCNIVSVQQVDGGFSIVVGSVKSIAEVQSMQKDHVKKTLVKITFRSLTGSELQNVYNKVFQAASNTINEYVNSL